MAETCETCRFWLSGAKREDYHAGLCRRHPPVVVQDPQRYLPGRWPETSFDRWCGEYQPRVETQPKPDKQRKPGYYWTRENGHDWVVGEWTGDRWFMPGLHKPKFQDPAFVYEDPCLHPIWS